MDWSGGTMSAILEIFIFKDGLILGHKVTRIFEKQAPNNLRLIKCHVTCRKYIALSKQCNNRQFTRI